MIFKKLKDNNIVCACTDVTVKEVLLNIQKNLNFNNMTFNKKLEYLDIGQCCGYCEEKDCDIIDTHYSEIFN